MPRVARTTRKNPSSGQGTTGRREAGGALGAGGFRGRGWAGLLKKTKKRGPRGRAALGLIGAWGKRKKKKKKKREKAGGKKKKNGLFAVVLTETWAGRGGDLRTIPHRILLLGRQAVFRVQTKRPRGPGGQRARAGGGGTNGFAKRTIGTKKPGKCSGRRGAQTGLLRNGAGTGAQKGFGGRASALRSGAAHATKRGHRAQRKAGRRSASNCPNEGRGRRARGGQALPQQRGFSERLDSAGSWGEPRPGPGLVDAGKPGPCGGGGSGGLGRAFPRALKNHGR